MIHTVSKAALDVSYRHKRTALGIVADLAAGWNHGAKTYEYDEHAAIDFPCDHTIKVELSVVPFPRGFHSEARRSNNAVVATTISITNFAVRF